MIRMKRSTARITLSTLLPQQERARMIARAARAERDSLIQSGRASPSYRTLVDGRDGAAEESIKPGGTIIYRFNTLGQAATFSLAYATARSPVLSGAYRRGWVVAVNGKPWVGAMADIPPQAEIMIVNAAPYHRKVETGAMRTIGRRIVEHLRQEVQARYPSLKAGVTYANLSGVMGGFRTPYIRKTGARRKDRAAGQPVTYPAVIITQRVGLG